MRWIKGILILIMLACQMASAADNIKILKRFEWNAPSYIKDYYRSNFADLINKNYDTLELKLKVDSINRELFNGGQFTSSLTYEVINLNANEVSIKLNFKLGEVNLFSFSGNKVFTSIELKTKVQEKIRNELGKVDLEQIKQMIIDAYDEIGFFDTQIVSYSHVGKNKFGVKVTSNYLAIEEGSKKRIAKLEFRGNQHYDKVLLNRIFEDAATPLSQDGYYDKEYAENFPNILKKKYLSEGFVYVEISRPRISYNDADDVEIEYLVNEKSQIILNKINFENLPSELVPELKAELVNQEAKPLNITELENDFKKVVMNLQMKGFYFVSIANLNGDDLLTYDSVNNSATLNLNINLERKVCFNDVVVNGNVTTKSIVLSREITLKKGELITPDIIETARQRLTGLGLFSSLRITPYMIYEDQKNNDCAKTNIIIQVKEKEFGLGEFTPGYRTDLGGKVALGLNYNNLGGMNRTVSFKVQANQRFNLDSLDDRRKADNKKLLEYSGKISFVEPYLLYDVFRSQVEFEMTGSMQRKRFFSFDADIYKISPQISKNFTNNISTSVRWQLERIIQFDATETKDNDNFTIGSITPSITLDKRNDAINPRKGFYLNLSSEWANRYFGSMRDTTFEVNYVKVISRNRFYFPLGDFVFATSIATGFEKNYAEGYYIPSIKVFRLDGFDEIRGYEDGEINRIPDGTLISEKAVTDKAYFVAFKFEPRYNLSDSMQLDIFFDAGRVFVDKFQPLDLRTSVGAGFKFLTPVGSLDFDYGIKLNKRTYPDQKRDTTGRFHLSIGFF